MSKSIICVLHHPSTVRKVYASLFIDEDTLSREAKIHNHYSSPVSRDHYLCVHRISTSIPLGVLGSVR